MKTRKRAIAMLLTMLMMFSMFPIYSSANNVIETAIAWATGIANDNTHGYSQANRYGPDYDCSSLVTTAFRNAGINVPYDCNTRNMKERFVNAGFVWIPASSIPNFPGSSANLQRGDILLKSGHTELYIGNNQNIGAHDNYNGIPGGIGGGKKWSDGYKAYRYGADEIDVCKYWNGSWTGVLRYNGGETIPTTAPTNVWVSLPNGPESSYKLNETFNINFGAEWADTYHVYIWRQHESESAFYYETYISAQSDGNGYCSVVFADIGHFSCVITASNALGSAQSEWIGWDIVDSAPYELSISTEKENYTTDEAVNFTLGAKYATYKHIGIHKIEGNETYLYRESDVNGSTISLSDFEPGLYRANFDAINAAGRTRSDWAYFSVCDSLTHCNEKIIDAKFLKSEATCVTKAVYYQSCSVCGAVSDITFEHGSELGHNYCEWYIVTVPTENKKGIKERKCNICKNSEQKAITYSEYFGTDIKKEILLSLSDVSVNSGDTVEVSFSLTGADSLNSISIGNLKYDKSLLALQKIEWKLSDSVISSTDGDYSVIKFSDNRDCNGVVYEVTFSVADVDSFIETEISCDVTARYELPDGNERTVDVKVENGVVRINGEKSLDYDKNGYVTTDDAVYVLKHIMMPDIFELTGDVDFDKNGHETTDDAVYLLKHIMMPDLYPI